LLSSDFQIGLYGINQGCLCAILGGERFQYPTVYGALRDDMLHYNSIRSLALPP
jgi:hypothetical protein